MVPGGLEVGLEDEAKSALLLVEGEEKFRHVLM